ncbi:hypothetical protein FBUS_00204 [Fasciolopsis buskii]|uniref:Uncharacterized protein n=1 Tax=Fasciolopsis buskii TaxID=27845 RepID=A0A8E0S523_9TREM|nr:hypothetical protein FBUS_00204 [Fasciolopsis buski]
MPKYCVEFIADVCTLPSQDDSDCTDSRDQQPFTVNPLSEPDWDIRLTPFIVPDPNKVVPSPRNIHLDNWPNPEPSLQKTIHSYTGDPRKASCNPEKTVHQGSHVTPMGNTVCCVPNRKNFVWDEADHRPSSTVNRYACDTVPVHRTFVISRAVQCGNWPTTEQTMYNNHSYHDTQLSYEVSKGGDCQNCPFAMGKTTASSRNPKRLSFASHVNGDLDMKVDELKQNTPKMMSLRSNSEMSVDVSSLSAQRCSSVTPPIKNNVDYPSEADREVMRANAVLLEDDIDSLSATMSVGSNSNFRETIRRHRQRPSPYTRPKSKHSSHCETARRLNNTFNLDLFEHTQKGPRRRQSSLYPMLAVSAFGDSAIRKSSRSFFDRASLDGAKERHHGGSIQESHMQKHKRNLRDDQGTTVNNVRFKQQRSDPDDSASTLDETLSVSSLEHPQSARITASTSEHPNPNPDCGKQPDANLQPHKECPQQHEVRNINGMIDSSAQKLSTEETYTPSEVPNRPGESTNAIAVNNNCGSNKTAGKIAITRSIPELNKHTTVKSALPRLNRLPVNSSMSNRSDLKPLVDTKILETNVTPIRLKTRSLSESRIPTNHRRYLPSPRAQGTSFRDETQNENKAVKLKQESAGSSPTKSQPEQISENPTARVNKDATEKPTKLDNSATQATSNKDPSSACTTVKQDSACTTVVNEKRPNLRLSRSLDRASTTDFVDYHELTKSPRRRESFSATLTTRKGENLFVPLKAQLGAQEKLRLSKDMDLRPAWGHKPTQSEPVSSVASCMELQQAVPSPSLLRARRHLLMKKRNSAPVSLKLPQSIQPTKITSKTTPITLPAVTPLTVTRRRSNESVLSAPLHIYTPHSRGRGKLVRHKFFIPESANIEAILADPDDRRIKAICERYKCDMEIYSKLPWCGFLQYIIVLAARDAATLRRCARTLDCRLNWCLDAQIR